MMGEETSSCIVEGYRDLEEIVYLFDKKTSVSSDADFGDSVQKRRWHHPSRTLSAIKGAMREYLVLPDISRKEAADASCSCHLHINLAFTE